MLIGVQGRSARFAIPKARHFLSENGSVAATSLAVAASLDVVTSLDVATTLDVAATHWLAYALNFAFLNSTPTNCVSR